jgi:hypothetical protein
MSTRRQFLGTLGKALGAGGLLLPLAGKGALALPAELGKAAQLPLTPAAIPLSSEFLQFREVWRELHHIYLSTPEDYTLTTRDAAWRDVMRNKCMPLGERIIGRKNPTWQDCREIAEICLHRMYRRGPHDRSDPLYALVWAVLSAGGVKEIFVPAIGDFSLDRGPSELWGRSE